jgi:hypothetical protein
MPSLWIQASSFIFEGKAGGGGIAPGHREAMER